MGVEAPAGNFGANRDSSPRNCVQLLTLRLGGSSILGEQRLVQRTRPTHGATGALVTYTAKARDIAQSGYYSWSAEAGQVVCVADGGITKHAR